MTYNKSGQFIWLRSRFDLEGVVGAAAALLLGVLFGMLWPPLFLLGVLGAVIALAATRTADRVIPPLDDRLLGPCDGVVVSIEPSEAPVELRLPDDTYLRVRMAGAPLAVSEVRAPMDAELLACVEEEGDNGAILAMTPERSGLARAYLALKSKSHDVGLVLAVGGLGPRLEIGKEVGSQLFQGDMIGRRRLGGWCDLYVSTKVRIDCAVGQTIIAGETSVATCLPAVETALQPGANLKAQMELPVAQGAEQDSPAPPKADGSAEDLADLPPDEAAAKLFGRLKREADKASEKSPEPGDGA